MPGWASFTRPQTTGNRPWPRSALASRMCSAHERSMIQRVMAVCCGWMMALSNVHGAPEVEAVDMLFHHWSTRDGLPNNRVRGVTRSRDGFIWLATDGGAVRFDGMNFRTFGLREGLLAPIVLAIRETPDRRIWLGTLGGGLSVYRNGGIETTYTTADGLPSNWVSRIEEDASGAMVAITRNGAARLAGDRFIPLPKDGTFPPPITSILRDGSGTLWGIAANKSLCMWKNGTWQRLAEGGPARTDAIAIDGKGRLWSTRRGTLWLHDRETWTAHPLPQEFQGQVANMAAASDGTLWLAFHRHGLCGFKDGRFITPKPVAGFTQDQVETVVSTSDGQLWVTSANGFYRMAVSRIRSSQVNDPAAPSVSNILGGLVEASPGEFIIATQGSGFYRWMDGHATRLSDDPGLAAGGYGNALVKAADGTIWLGAQNGLYELKPDGTILKHAVPGDPNDGIWGLAEYPEGLWVGTSFGRLHLLAKGNFETIDYGGDAEPIKAFARKPDGSLWVGTRGKGLHRRSEGRWELFDRRAGLLSDIIRCLYIDPEGRLWVGSDGGGLSLRLNDKRFISVTSLEGLPSNTVSQIVMDPKGRLWVGTHRGLAVFDRDAVAAIAAGRLENLHPLLINEADGMPADELTIVPPILTSDGTTAFATTRGFFRLNTDDFEIDTRRPSVFMEGVRAKGTPINFTPRMISLPAGADRLEFAFTGLNFHDPARLKFRTRMKGLDDDWVLIGDRRVTDYRNLLPGTYQFQVEATTGNGLWSTSPAVVDIIIAPHYWQTRWFQIAVILACFGVVIASVWLPVRWRARRKIETLRRRQAVDSERARIARDLHDDVGASLTQMALQSQLAERNVVRQPERAVSHLHELFKTASRMTRTLDEIVWAVNPKHDTLENFILFLSSHTQDLAESAGLRCRFEMPDSIPERMMPSHFRHHLYLAAKEVLHNTVKHANASEITLHVRLDGNTLIIHISDDGEGFDDGGPAAIGADGLANMRERLRSLHGSCQRHSTPGEGTSVEMRVPMNWRHG
jgi:signal transduction histidine kinase/ligand-binding sensor domain-containing protein